MMESINPSFVSELSSKLCDEIGLGVIRMRLLLLVVSEERRSCGSCRCECSDSWSCSSLISSPEFLGWVDGSDDPESVLIGLIAHGSFDGFSSDFFSNEVLRLIVSRERIAEDFELSAFELIAVHDSV